MIGDVKANQGDEQANIGFSQPFTQQEGATIAEQGFQFVELAEDVVKGLLIAD